MSWPGRPAPFLTERKFPARRPPHRAYLPTGLTIQGLELSLEPLLKTRPHFVSLMTSPLSGPNVPLPLRMAQITASRGSQ